MPMERPNTREAYVRLVNQALLNAGELRSTTQVDTADAMGTATTLENNLRALYMSMIGGSYQHEDEDLDFMSIVDTVPDDSVPFKPLLRLINQTHRQGLDNQ